MSKWVFEENRDGRKTKTDVDEFKWPKTLPKHVCSLLSNVTVSLLSSRSESGLGLMTSFGQWDISKHKTSRGLPPLSALFTLQLSTCVQAQANLLNDEKNVIITPIDIAPNRQTNKQGLLRPTDQQTIRHGWGHAAPSWADKDCPESPTDCEKNL